MRDRLKQRDVSGYRKKLLRKQGGLCPLCGQKIESGDDTLDHCFTPDVEVLTERGFIPFSGLTEGIKVVQWDEYRLSLVDPSRIISQDYDGEIVSLSKRSYSLSCTANHNIVLMDRATGRVFKQKACDITVGDKKKARYTVIPKHGFYDGHGIDLSDDDIRLYVAFQADGCDTTGARFRLRRYDKIQRIERILGALDIPYTLHKTDCYQLYIGVNDRPPYLTKQFNIPLFAFSLRQLQVFVEELKFWDGNISGGGVQYSSTDPVNAEYVRIACVLSGYRSTGWVRERSAGPHNRLYCVHLSKPIKGDSNRNITREVKQYQGKVYCVTVPSGAVVVRHNGYVSIAGNCHESGRVRAVLHRNCNQIEGRIRHWALRAHADPIEFLEAIAAHWAKEYDHLPLHPSHRSEDEKEILRLKRRRRKLKTQRGKDRLTQQIKALGG